MATDVAKQFAQDATSIGAMHGSAKGGRNVRKRIEAMERLGGMTKGRLLDIGCGTGEYTRTLAQGCTQVDGIEIERNRLDHFREDCPSHVDLHLMSANELDFADDTFDTVVMIEVLEHLADPATAMKEIGRVLKPGGSLLLTTPSRRWPLEQHGVLFRGKRYKSIYAPGLVWVKPLHARFSDAGAFEPNDIAELGAHGELELRGHTFMMPPLDSLSEGHRVHTFIDQAEDKIGSHFGQTIIARLDLAIDLDA